MSIRSYVDTARDETQMDPTNKLRVSTPQALIDTDFEYGTQVSKWENLAMTNNRPFVYAQATPVAFTSLDITGRTVTVTSAANPALGSAVVVNDSYLSIANGTFVVDTTSGSNFTYTSRAASPYLSQTAICSAGSVTAGSNVTISSLSGTIYVGQIVTVSGGSGSVPAGTYVTKIVNATTIQLSANTTSLAGVTLTFGAVRIIDPNKTSITLGSYYTASQINTVSVTAAASGTANDTMVSDGAVGTSKISVYLSNAHGLSIGNEIQVASVTGLAGAVGAFYVAQVISPTAFAYYTRTQVTAFTGTPTDIKIYARAQGTVLHRPFDGGVIFSSNGGSNYEQQVRQTRRYFRYQSGKGIQMSSGTILKPNFQVDSMVYKQATGVITITLKDVHNLQTVPPDAQVLIYGANETGFNGSFYVTNVVNYNSFTVTPAVGTFTADTTASGNYYVSTSGWYGAVNRLGIFDQQNGLFFEFDGQILYAVRRNSTYQLGGRALVVKGSTAVTASSLFATTSYTKQLTGGDFIVIKGQSYRVESVTDDSNFTISPSYRGASADNLTISKTIDTKIPQSQWNLDKLDGTGPSGYTIDLTKMQMFYIDFSWYGAGFVRWGFRTTDGNVTYVHKLQNNNVNAEAYMRSGNLPGRYESGTIPPVTAVTKAIGASDTTITVADTSKFPTSGTLYVKNYNIVEHVYYTSKTATSFTGITRATAGAQVTGFTPAVGSNTLDLTSATFGSGSVSTIQIGQRVIASNANVFSDACFVTKIVGNVISLSNAAITATSSTINFVPMSATTGQAFPITSPTTVELAYPTLAPTISHWGTSVIMDGRFDDDKSLLFTYGQKAVTGLTPVGVAAPTGINVTTVLNSSTVTLSSATSGVTVGMVVSSANLPVNTVVTSVNGATATVSTAATAGAGPTAATFSAVNSAALMAIRVAPSVDNGKPGQFGTRELINRMQLVLRALDVSIIGTGNILVQLVLNNSVGTNVAWTSAVGIDTTLPNSSLAQIADYAGQNIQILAAQKGEVTGGFYTSSTTSLDLSLVRDLGNSILGGGTPSGSDYSSANIYPDGPDVVTILVTNVGNAGLALSSRLSWTEAQA